MPSNRRYLGLMPICPIPISDIIIGLTLRCIYIFGRSCRWTEFCHVQNSLYVQVLHSRILVALLHSTPAAGSSQTLLRGTRNGIMELSHRAPPIFGWAAITLGIGPHSSCVYFVLWYISFDWRMSAFVVLGFVFPYQAKRLAWGTSPK